MKQSSNSTSLLLLLLSNSGVDNYNIQIRMKLLEEIKVSVYDNVYSKNPKIMTFPEVIIMCIHPVYASIINTIRRFYLEGDREAAQQIKSKLPCFTPAGTFNGAHAIKNFLVSSNIVGLDYDHVPTVWKLFNVVPKIRIPLQHSKVPQMG